MIMSKAEERVQLRMQHFWFVRIYGEPLHHSLKWEEDVEDFAEGEGWDYLLERRCNEAGIDPLSVPDRVWDRFESWFYEAAAELGLLENNA